MWLESLGLVRIPSLGRGARGWRYRVRIVTRSAPPFRCPIRRRTDKAARASDSESHFPLNHKSGNIEMLPFIILALLAILTKSPVAIAGLLSYIIGLFGYI